MSIELWNSLAQRAGSLLEPGQIDRLNAYLDLLLAANRRMNLTGISDRAEAELLHIGDALTLLPFLPAGPHRLADVGSGGGVPGMVLAIVRPNLAVVLIESTQKKGDFLSAAAKELVLENVTVDPRRAENVAHSEARESFDVVVARAVGLLPIMAEWLLPLARVGGYALAMKGPKGAQELRQARRAIQLMGGGPPEIFPANLQPESGHLIIKMPKVGPTPPRFPRDPSIAKGKAI